MSSATLAGPFRPKHKVLSSLFRPIYFFSFLILCGWLLWKALTPSLPKSDTPLRLYSNQSQGDLTLTFLEAIRQATHSIDLIMFGLSDPGILKELEKKGKEGISPQVYYDFSGSPNLHTLLPHCVLHPILQTGLMHQKILILDEEMVFLGSANMTPQSLQMHDNLVIGLSNQKIASFLKEKAARSSGHLRTLVGGQEISLWLLPDLKNEALNELRIKLQNARHSIKVALFTFTHPLLLKELLIAHKKGIQVTVVVDMHSGVGASKKTVETLQKAGVPLLFSQGIQLLHHKFVYIDGETLITGSANWTKSAFEKNSDILLFLPHLLEEQKKFMDSLWHRLTSTAKKPNMYPPHSKRTEKD
ncbi:MAG: hypothetical protein HY324_01305 [Chlamydiia bacterium]|nr:hypothetical protein [Chlamydiia bacterium]